MTEINIKSNEIYLYKIMDIIMKSSKYICKEKILYSLVYGIMKINEKVCHLKNFIESNNYQYDINKSDMENFNDFVYNIYFKKEYEDITLFDIYNLLNKISLFYFKNNVNDIPLYEMYLTGIDYNDFEYFYGFRDGNFSYPENYSFIEINSKPIFEDEIMEINKNEIFISLTLN